MNEIESSNLNDTTTVVFYPADSDNPLFICEMVCPPRVGESVKVPTGEVGVVTAVNWEINSDSSVFAGIILRLTE